MSSGVSCSVVGPASRSLARFVAFVNLPDDATELLLKNAMVGTSDGNRAACSSFARELGYLAVAVVQAGAYIARSSCLLTYLSKKSRATHAEKQDADRLPMVRVYDMGDEAREILQIATATEEAGDALQDAATFLQHFKSHDDKWSEFLFLEAANDLSSYSLINVNEEGSIYSFHCNVSPAYTSIHKCIC